MFSVYRNAVLILISVLTVRATYSIHFVENSCKQGNETIIYQLHSSPTSAVILRAAKTTPYSPSKNCTIILQPPPGYGVVLAVRKIDFTRSVSSALNWDYLMVFHSASTNPTMLKRFKFDVYEKLSYSSNEAMTLLYHTVPRFSDLYLEIGFEVTVTAFTTEPEECAREFRCDNGRCIKNDLTCDGHNNCGDFSDESRFTCDKITQMPDVPERYIVVISICVLLFLFVMSCTVFCCVKNKTPNEHSEDSSPEQSVIQPCITTPYEALHPSGYFVSENPAGPSLYPIPHSSIMQQTEGFFNPCYPSGIPQHPPPSYKP